MCGVIVTQMHVGVCNRAPVVHYIFCLLGTVSECVTAGERVQKGLFGGGKGGTTALILVTGLSETQLWTHRTLKSTPSLLPVPCATRAIFTALICLCVTR